MLTVERLRTLALADIVGRTDLGRLRLPTESEVAALVGDVGNGRNRGTISDWRLIVVEFRRLPLEIIIVGTRDGTNWGTSPVRAFAGDRTRARTRSGSIYRLVEPGTGEPPIEHLLHLCFMLHAWGMGRVLGVPEVWY
jgi:hypothetical protein